MPWIFILVFIMGAATSSYASSEKSSPWLRVRLKSGLSELSLEGKDFAWAEEAKAIRPVAVPRSQKLKVTRAWNGRGWLWKVDGLRADGLSVLRQGDKLALRADQAKLNGETVPSRVLLSAKSGNFDLIGVVPLEEYLVGVLAGEVPVRWPMETLKAQAVVARSYAQAVRDDRSQQTYHLESTIEDQVYRPVDSLPATARDRLEQAVRETSGLFLHEPGGRVLKAYYHSDCGGRTASASDVWGGGFDAGTAVDPFCPATPGAMWSLRVAKDAFSKAMSSLLSRAPGSSGRGRGFFWDPSAMFLQRGEDERVLSLNVKDADGTTKEIPAAELRRELGYGRMKSTRFEVRDDGDEILIAGRGFGHGVGLCQWGSRGWALRGWTAEKILSHYYPKAVLKREKTPETRAWL